MNKLKEKLIIILCCIFIVIIFLLTYLFYDYFIDVSPFENAHYCNGTCAGCPDYHCPCMNWGFQNVNGTCYYGDRKMEPYAYGSYSGECSGGSYTLWREINNPNFIADEGYNFWDDFDC